MVATAASPQSKLFSLVSDHLDDLDAKLTLLDRGYWAENAGFDYIKALALVDDVEAIKLSASASYYAVCCMAAVGASLGPFVPG